MRKVWSLVVVAMLVALALGVSAQAGGKGSLKVDLLVGFYPEPTDEDPLPNSEILQPPTKVGFVVFQPAANGTMHVTIHLQDAAPNQEFKEVFVVPLAVWGRLSEQDYSMTTNSRGKATIHLVRPMPEEEPEDFFIKAIVREFEREGLVYVTDRYDLPLK